MTNGARDMLSMPAATISSASPALIGAAEDDVVDRRPIQVRVPAHQRLERHRGEVVSPYDGERAAETTDRRAHEITDEGLRHHRASRAAVTQTSKNTVSSG